MKFICKKTDLINAINIVQKAIKSNSTVSILDGILIETGSGSIKLTGYDLETGIEADVNADIIESGSVVADSKLFGEIVKRLPEETVDIKTDERFQVHISSGNSNFAIKGLDSEPFPKIPVIENGNKIIVRQNVLRSMINHTIFAVSKDSTRTKLTGCNLVSDGNTLSMVAIDGFRMALNREDMGSEFPEMNYIVPGKALTELAKILGDGDDEEVNLFASANHLLFDIGNVRMISRLIQGEFVNFESIIVKNPKTVMNIDRKTLLDSVERASLIIMTDERRCPVQFSMPDDNTLVVSANAETGNSKESIDISIEGERIDIDFNAKYMIDALKNIDDDEIRIEFNGGNGPCIIVPKEGNKYVYLVLPIRR